MNKTELIAAIAEKTELCALLGIKTVYVLK